MFSQYETKNTFAKKFEIIALYFFCVAVSDFDESNYNWQLSTQNTKKKIVYEGSQCVFKIRLWG